MELRYPIGEIVLLTHLMQPATNQLNYQRPSKYCVKLLAGRIVTGLFILQRDNFLTIMEILELKEQPVLIGAIIMVILIFHMLPICQ